LEVAEEAAKDFEHSKASVNQTHQATKADSPEVSLRTTTEPSHL